MSTSGENFFQTPSRTVLLRRIGILAIAYASLGLFGLSFAEYHVNVTLVWPCGFSISVRGGIIELFPADIRSVNGEW